MRSTRGGGNRLSSCRKDFTLDIYRCAFTLAEVLITLGIVGVIAAMTLTSLINETKNKNLETALNKQYSVIQQSILMMQQEEGQEVNWINYPKYVFYERFKKYLTLTKTKFNNLETFITNYKNFSGQIANGGGAYLDDGQYILADGTIIYVENPNNLSSETSHLYISVDVNGTKKPNQWGRDLFTFQVTKQGKVLPMGMEGTDFSEEEYCIKNKKDNSINGIGCTSKALYDKSFWK